MAEICQFSKIPTSEASKASLLEPDLDFKDRKRLGEVEKEEGEQHTVRVSSNPGKKMDFQQLTKQSSRFSNTKSKCMNSCELSFKSKIPS